MVGIEKIKRKKIGIQEKNNVLTLEGLKQSTRHDIDLILDYLEKFPDEISSELKERLKKKLDVSGGTILGDLDIEGNITKNGEDLSVGKEKSSATLKLINRQYITYTDPWVTKLISLDSFNSNNINNLFSQTNGGIKVNRDAKLLISGNVSIMQGNVNSNELDVILFGSSLGAICPAFGNHQTYMKTYSISPTLVPITAGEIISLGISTGEAATYTILEKATYLTLEEV